MEHASGRGTGLRQADPAAAADRPTRNRLVLGLDIGGTKLAAGVLEEAGSLHSWVRTPTHAHEGPDPVIGRLLLLARQAMESARVDPASIDAIGVGCGGPLDPETGVIHDPPNLPGWHEVPLAAMLRRALGRPVYVENDANAGALGEYHRGAGRGVENMIYLTISTGIGGGIVIGGRLYRGETGNAGEIGHMTMVWNGRPCTCGSRGCLEAYASGTSIARRAREAIESGEASVLTEIAGSTLAVTAATVIMALRSRDPLAVRIWDESMEILGAGIASVANIFDPARVVLGGGVTQAGAALFDPVRRVALSRVLPPRDSSVAIVPSQLGVQLGVVGAAVAALERHARATGSASDAPPESAVDSNDDAGPRVSGAHGGVASRIGGGGTR